MSLLESEREEITRRVREVAADLDRYLAHAPGSLPARTKALAEELTTALKADAVEALVSERLKGLADCLREEDAEDRPILEALGRLQPLLGRARQVREATASA